MIKGCGWFFIEDVNDQQCRDCPWQLAFSQARPNELTVYT
jgi:hypothetical protein